MEDVELTEQQRKVLDFIIGYVRLAKYPPTYREMAMMLFMSLSSVTSHVHHLRDAGFLTVKPHSPRSIRLIER